MKAQNKILSLCIFLTSAALAMQQPDVVFAKPKVQGNLEIGKDAREAVIALADALKQTKLLDAKELAAALEAGKLHQVLLPLAEALPKTKLIDMQHLPEVAKTIAAAIKEARPIDTKELAAAFEKARLIDTQPLANALPNIRLVDLQPLADALQKLQLIDTKSLADGLKQVTVPLAAAMRDSKLHIDFSKIGADVNHTIMMPPSVQQTVETARQVVDEGSTRVAGCCCAGAAFLSPEPCCCCMLFTGSLLLLTAPAHKIKAIANGTILLAQDALESCLPQSLKAKLLQASKPGTLNLALQVVTQPVQLKAPGSSTEQKTSKPDKDTSKLA